MRKASEAVSYGSVEERQSRTDLLVYHSLDEMREGGHSIEHTKENSSGK
jgi:hypothetical protein